MARFSETGWVDCFYANPKTGKVEKHRLSTVSFEEATRPRRIGDGSNRVETIASGEEHLWTLDPPDGAEIVDLSPASFEQILSETAPASPPQAAPTNAVDPLRRGPRRKAA